MVFYRYILFNWFNCFNRLRMSDIVLYDHQNICVDEIRTSFKDKNSAPLFVLPTGGGKTVIFCHIAKQTALNSKRVWILVHRVELLRQTSKSLTKSGVHHGLINPKYTPDFNAPVQVASVQTVINRLSKLPPPDLIIIDEAHHATAGSWKKIIDFFPEARILGVTATPTRADGKGLGIDYGGCFDDLIIGPQIGELIDMGFLVKPIVYAPKKRIDFSKVNLLKNGDYDPSETLEIMDKPTITGDAVKHYMKICSGVPAVAFCVSISHAEHVAEEFRAAGFRAYSVDGSMDDSTRKRILEGLGDGSIDVVTSCDLISEGTDIPAIGCAILLRPTNSLSLFIQQGGRALRILNGKSHAIILDHVGNTFNHGFLDSEREWSLEGKKKKTKKNDSEKTIRVVQCKECYAVYEPSPKCTYCGFVSPVRETEPEKVDGELQEITDEQKAIIKKNQRQQVGMAKTLEQLQELGKQRGYKPGWAKQMFKARNEKLI